MLATSSKVMGNCSGFVGSIQPLAIRLGVLAARFGFLVIAGCLLAAWGKFSGLVIAHSWAIAFCLLLIIGFNVVDVNLRFAIASLNTTPAPLPYATCWWSERLGYRCCSLRFRRS